MRELFSEYLLTTMNVIASFIGIKMFIAIFYGHDSLIVEVIENFINSIV